MEKLIIHGGKCLNGTVKISGAKNSVLPILASSLLSSDQIIIGNEKFTLQTQNGNMFFVIYLRW